jgi:hypothetical protein
MFRDAAGNHHGKEPRLGTTAINEVNNAGFAQLYRACDQSRK